MANKIKTFLITGGAGFIGSAVIRHLLNNTDHKIINVDKLTYASNLNSIEINNKTKRYFFEKIDICNKNGIKKILQNYKPDIIMHLAAESHVDRSISCAKNFINTNIIGTYTLLECTLSYWLNLTEKRKKIFRFHHISTDEVYGDLDFTKKEKFTEESPYMPSSPYSASKASSDHLVRSWHRTFKLPIIITNSSNNYGPFQHKEKFIPTTILNAIAGKKIPIYGDGNQIRDWLFVEDHALALSLIAQEGDIGETYNIGGGNELKNIDVVRKICKLLDKLLPSRHNNLKKYEELISYVNDRPGHDRRYSVDFSKVSKKLDWSPLESFSSGIKKTINWYINEFK